jgi:ketosteroid isomerase-like protein
MTDTEEVRAQPRERAAEDVRALLEEHAAAIRAADADRLADCYLPGAEVFDLAPPLRKTFDAEGMRAWFAGHGNGPMVYDLAGLDVTAGQDTAYGHALVRLGGPGFTMWMRVTYGLRRVDGRWLLAHVHESTPFHMDGSNRAAVDLVP